MPKKNKDNAVQSKNNLVKKIKKLAAGLFYVSETDGEISPFAGRKAESNTKEFFLTQIGGGNLSPEQIEERNFEDFFARLTKIEDWFGDEEKHTAEKFSQLKELLQKELKDVRVYKVGKIELDIYVVGLDSENVLTGIRTKAVET